MATHTYRLDCRLAPVVQPAADTETPPPIRAQFFYSSLIPIDDPLASGSLAGLSETKATKGQLRPFSRGDNNALERAWLSLASNHHRRNHIYTTQNRSPSPSLAKKNIERLHAVVGSLADKHYQRHGADVLLDDGVSHAELHAHAHAHAHAHGSSPPAAAGATTPVPTCCDSLYQDVEDELKLAFCAAARRRQYRLSQDNVAQDVMVEFRRRYSKQLSCPPATARPSGPAVVAGAVGAAADAGISGQPFIRVGAPNPPLVCTSPLPNAHQIRNRGLGSAAPPSSINPPSAVTPAAPSPANEEGIKHDSDGAGGRDTTSPAETALGIAMREPASEATGSQGVARGRLRSAEVTVGISRLHMVSLPALHMKPIYWSPVHDVSVVTRATWFYKDTMLPVPPSVANQLETGYEELRPWTETWNDELRCAVDVGSAGEEKVSHRLWPEESSQNAKACHKMPEPKISTDPYCAARCCCGQAAAEGTLHQSQTEDQQASSRRDATPPRSFSSYHVIYKDERLAYLLKPSLKPSAYYGRRPVSKVMKGLTVGIPVVRGFDAAAWEALHDRTRARERIEVRREQVNGEAGVGAAVNGETAGPNGPQDAGVGTDECPACVRDKERGQVTDLVLVIHGIGQKFAEKVESFHFTHAINAFRRAVNVELGNPQVRAVLRGDQNGIMVLPVNWRHKLSFEDGGPMTEADKQTYTPDGFGLKDIEPPTIPAVRSMISDIMFDIPFYMSHHKPKMIQALVQEANRVYRLWCRNNPGFDETGRVHLIGHSLGSAMAIDILSRQPNSVPRPMPPPPPSPPANAAATYFDFDTVNLFLVGSPAGFFLLLERGLLMPRRGRMKPGAKSTDSMAPGVVAEAGRFGCVAVDNIYNILAKEDPIAYLLNGTIDAAYAAGLKTAYAPSTSTSILQAVGNAVRSVVPGASGQPPGPTVATCTSTAMDTQSVMDTATSTSTRGKLNVERLPSQLELEVHDFTREEIAERKAYLLNDNGQIDYYLHSAGGALEIQYLNMLSAHSCYWTHRDFIRLLCMEVGRRPGRAHTLAPMRAVKAKSTHLGRVESAVSSS